MDRVRFRTASLLGLVGLIEVAECVCGFDPLTMITVLLGAACLAVSTLMFKNVQVGDYMGGILALLGLWAADAGMARIPLLLTALLMLLEVFAVAGCFYLELRTRQMVPSASH